MRGGRSVRRSITAALALTSLLPLHALSPARAASPVFDPVAERTIIEFTVLSEGLGNRLRRAGVTHAAMIPSASAVAVAAPGFAVEAIAGWDDVVATYPDDLLRTFMWQAARDTGVDLVRAGVKPLRGPYLGDGVTVALVDTGIDTAHPDLSGTVHLHLDFAPAAIFNPLDAAGSGEQSIIAEPVAMPTGVDRNAVGHGTHAASVVAGRGVAADGPDDLRGVAPSATLVDLNLGGELISFSSVLAAFDWILRHHDDPRFPNGIKVATAGVGSSCDGVGQACELPLLRSVLTQLAEVGVISVFPAGPARARNGLGPEAPADDIAYPARYDEVIAAKGWCKRADDWSAAAPLAGVGVRTEPLGGPPAPGSWCDPGGPRTRFGSSAVDAVAPAVDIWVASPTGREWMGFDPRWRAPAPGGGDPDAEARYRRWYRWAIADSLAAAHVAGIVALMVQASPCLTHDDAHALLRRTARDIGEPGFDTTTGHGTVDALAAVRAAERHGQRDRSCR